MGMFRLDWLIPSPLLAAEILHNHFCFENKGAGYAEWIIDRAQHAEDPSLGECLLHGVGFESKLVLLDVPEYSERSILKGGVQGSFGNLARLFADGNFLEHSTTVGGPFC
jgi:hypothetical protein